MNPLHKIKSYLGNTLTSIGVWGWSMPGEWNKQDLLRQYQRYVYTIVQAISENAAKVEFEVERVSPRGKVTQLPNHPFLKLMRKPNPDFSKFQFLELHFTFMKMTGESFWYVVKGAKSGLPMELYLLRPDLMEVVIDEKDPRGLVKGYVLRKPDGTDIPFDREEIQHFKLPNPRYPYRGMGPVQAGKYYIETEEYSSRWKRNSIYNSGRPSGIVNIKGKITEEQFKSLKKQFKNEYSGPENAGKTMFLKGADGLDYERLAMELNEVALKELRDMTLDDIMVMFRASKTILGITDDVNRANAKEAKNVFIENLIIPELDRMVDQLDAFFIDTFGEDVHLTYEDPRISDDKDKMEVYDKALYKWMTVNEVREDQGLDPIDGGDKLYVPMNLMPIEADPLDTNPTDNNNGTDTSTGEPPTDGESTNPVSDEPTEQVANKLKKKRLNVIKEGDSPPPKASPEVVQNAENFRVQLYKNQAQWEKHYEDVMQKEFKKQKAEILNKNKSYKKGVVVKDVSGWLFDVTKSNKRIESALTPMALQLIAEQARLALDLAGDEDTEFMITQEIRDYVDFRVTKLAQGTNDVTIEKLKETIGAGILEGESVDKLIERVQAVYQQANDVRAELIARTETIAASNAAAEQAYTQSPVVTYKEWFANPGACEFCLALQGKVVGLSVSFLRLGESVTGESGKSYDVTYDNVDHPPLHPDCRCTILPVRN